MVFSKFDRWRLLPYEFSPAETWLTVYRRLDIPREGARAVLWVGLFDSKPSFGPKLLGT